MRPRQKASNLMRLTLQFPLATRKSAIAWFPIPEKQGHSQLVSNQSMPYGSDRPIKTMVIPGVYGSISGEDENVFLQAIKTISIWNAFRRNDVYHRVKCIVGLFH